MFFRRLSAAVVVAIAMGLAPSAASAWAPASTATIHPGVQTTTAGNACTAGFVFTAGGKTYLSQAAHCSGPGTATASCGVDSFPLGTSVAITGASQPGKLAYSSYLAMQGAGETDFDACGHNDFALIELDPADVAAVNPSLPGWGGPVGVGTAAVQDNVYAYGSSALHLGIPLLHPKRGKVVQLYPNGWAYIVYTLLPGLAGDSGSPYLNAGGQALGVLSTIVVSPLTLLLSNGVGDLGKEMAYARAHGFSDLTLVDGTEPFNPGLLG